MRIELASEGPGTENLEIRAISVGECLEQDELLILRNTTSENTCEDALPV